MANKKLPGLKKMEIETRVRPRNVVWTEEEIVEFIRLWPIMTLPQIAEQVGKRQRQLTSLLNRIRLLDRELLKPYKYTTVNNMLSAIVKVKGGLLKSEAKGISKGN